jgi:hypothetical protein
MSTLHLVPDTQFSTPSAGASRHAEAARLVNHFAYYCGGTQLPWMFDQVERWLEEGFEPGVIREAIERTAQAPRPSWRYLAAIIWNARRCGCFSEADWLMGESRMRRAPREFPL